MRFLGIMGALDAAWVISKDDRFSDEATLSITGRDMESRQLKVVFEKSVYRWRSLGPAADIEAQRQRLEYERSPVVQTIKKLIEQGGGHWEGSASDIQKASVYFKCPIYDDVRSIGRLINQYAVYLWTDRIEVEHGKGTKGVRFYKFHATNATNDMNVTNASQ